MFDFYLKIESIFNSLKVINNERNILRVNYGEEFNFFNFIFLCGGNAKKYFSRDKILEIVQNDYPVIIAEKFKECRGKLDLLAFERVIEAISSVVLICVESPGTICELGAFTNVGDNNSDSIKEMIIFDKDEQNKKSFINLGPVLALNNINQNRVYYATYKNGSGKEKSGFTIDESFLNDERKQILSKKSYLHSFYRIDSGKFIIKDLTTFFAIILDLACLIGYINNKIVFNYFKKMYGIKSLYLDCDGFKNTSKSVKNVMSAYFAVLSKLQFLKEDKTHSDFLYFINPAKIASKSDRKWFGSVLFKQKFLEDEKYLFLKSDFDYARKFL
ncbi:MAG: retron St85 family effector protein [archaeon]|nr:retron St85 family effector protein [Bacilli bacterium]MCQ2976445.1 retron St85 family effector protein [archaeon]